MEKKVKHLKMIQGIINRMANSSFLLKGWSVVLVSALFALSAKDSNIYYIYLAYFPLVAFWILDGYFLSQERLFIKLYDSVRLIKEEDIDFSMDRALFKKEAGSWINAIFSKTLNIFYGTVFSSIAIVTLIVIFRANKGGG